MHSEQDRQILERYFTSTESDVFALVNMPEVVKGALFSRYSRSSKDLRRLFLTEFYQKEGIVLSDAPQASAVDARRAEDFYDRVLVGYGDDSVAELGGAHVAIERISMVATKAIEEHRVGLSPLEKSTRYVRYDQKDEGGRYPYLLPYELLRSPYGKEARDVIDSLFDTYSNIVTDIQPFLRKMHPGDENDAAYRASIRAKACDIARALLPLATVTNMGVYGNGRAFEYLLTDMIGDPLTEVRDVGLEMHQALGLVIPSFIKRAVNERGDQARAYKQQTTEAIRRLVAKHDHEIQAKLGFAVKLVDFDEMAVEKIYAAAIYQHTHLDYNEALCAVYAMDPAERAEIIKVLAQDRQNRFHKPLRETEEPYFGFEVVADWGTYKDLMRHRILTRHKKRFSSAYGYYTPPELIEAGMDGRYREAMDRAAALQQRVEATLPLESQYLVCHGSMTPFYMKLNLRSLTHLVELRSTPQGHPMYRIVAQNMARSLSEQIPELAPLMKFVDYSSPELERLAAFRKLQDKGYRFEE